MTKLCEVIETSCRERVLLLGDFNLPTIDWTHLGGVTRHDDMFLEIVKDNFLTQHVMSPTRGTNILDLVITSDSNMIENLTLCEPLVNSDHVVLMFDFIFRNTIINENTSYRNYRKANYREINAAIQCIDWDFWNMISNVDELWE